MYTQAINGKETRIKSNPTGFLNLDAEEQNGYYSDALHIEQTNLDVAVVTTKQ